MSPRTTASLLGFVLDDREIRERWPSEYGACHYATFFFRLTRRVGGRLLHRLLRADAIEIDRPCASKRKLLRYRGRLVKVVAQLHREIRTDCDGTAVKATTVRLLNGHRTRVLREIWLPD